MRHPVLAAFFLLGALGGAAASDSGWRRASLGTGGYNLETGSAATPGMTGSTAAYLRKGGFNARTYASFGAMERSIPLDAWRGKRLLLSLRLKQEGEGQSSVGLIVRDDRDTPIVAVPQQTELNDLWHPYQFVLDIPEHASEAVLRVSLNFVNRQKPVVWVDDVVLEAVGPDVPTTRSSRMRNAPPSNCMGECGSVFSPYYARDQTIAPFAMPPANHETSYTPP